MLQPVATKLFFNTYRETNLNDTVKEAIDELRQQDSDVNFAMSPTFQRMYPHENSDVGMQNSFEAMYPTDNSPRNGNQLGVLELPQYEQNTPNHPNHVLEQQENRPVTPPQNTFTRNDNTDADDFKKAGQQQGSFSF